ncbi:MAG TPA: amidohydrolase family protein [Gemmatimonadaceae bacterium]|nr:amidohydrolase family protein [Gemmatimonadaceae bacterium]
MILYHAPWVLPVAAPPIRDGTVGVEGERIAYVGPRAGAPPGADRELGEVVLMPGLVNAHTHLELTAMRGFLEQLGFQPWIDRLTRARRAVLAEPDVLLDCARWGIVEGLRAGVTTYADTSDSSAPFHAMRELGVRGVMYQEVFGPDPAQCPGALAGLREKVERLRPSETALVRVGVSPHAPYSVSDTLFAATAHYAGDEGLPLAVHVAESAEESEYVTAAGGPWARSHAARGIHVAPRGRSSIAMLERTGVLRPNALLIHCVRADPADVAAIAAGGCGVAHCPASNAKLGHGVAPLVALLAAGVRVGIGSDSVASNNRMDILDEARLAVLMQRARLGDPLAVPGALALELATLGGARALGIDDRVGSLEPGKDADLAAYSLRARRAVPVQDPADAAVFALSGCDAKFVAVAGRVRVRDGRLVDEDQALGSRVQAAADRLAAWAGTNA